MKKIIALLLTAALLFMTACDPKENDPKGTDGSTAPTSDASTSEAPTDSAPASTDTQPAETTDTSEVPPPDLTSETGGDNGDATVTQKLYDAIANSGVVEMPFMCPVFETDIPKFFNADNTEEFTAQQAAISTIFVYIIIIEAKADKVDEVFGELNAAKDFLKDGAFYPQGTEAAQNTVVGKSGNIVYLLCHKEGAAMEEVLLENM
jgi:hypothetical protein